jgi:hypothetical protein
MPSSLSSMFSRSLLNALIWVAVVCTLLHLVAAEENSTAYVQHHDVLGGDGDLNKVINQVLAVISPTDFHMDWPIDLCCTPNLYACERRRGRGIVRKL